MATQKCMAWGYEGAESSGPQRNDCLSRREFGNCGTRHFTVEYSVRHHLTPNSRVAQQHPIRKQMQRADRRENKWKYSCSHS